MSEINYTERLRNGLEMLAKGIEVWEDIPNYEGLYWASNFGEIWSVERFETVPNRWGSCTTRKIGGRILTQWKQKGMCTLGDYLGVTLHAEDGRQRSWGVHRLVMLAFGGPPPCGFESCHYDGNPANNRLDNLRWGTSASNKADMKRHGTVNRGERNGQVLCTETDVVEMRRLYATGKYRMKDIAKMFGLSPNSASPIIRGIVWKHVAGAIVTHEGKGTPKLNPETVKEIRELYATGEYSQEKLADMYGVVQSTIGYVVRGSRW